MAGTFAAGELANNANGVLGCRAQHFGVSEPCSHFDRLICFQIEGVVECRPDKQSRSSESCFLRFYWAVRLVHCKSIHSAVACFCDLCLSLVIKPNMSSKYLNLMRLHHNAASSTAPLMSSTIISDKYSRANRKKRFLTSFSSSDAELFVWFLRGPLIAHQPQHWSA